MKGASKLSNGSDNLFSGISELRSGSGQLVAGINKLTEGACTLNDGMKEFKNKGIDKIIETCDGDIEPIINRLTQLQKLSEDYNTFSGIAEGVKGDVKFIYETDAIENKKN